MSKILSTLLALALASGASGALAATFKIATLSPEGSSWMKLLRASAERIEARTGGEVKFKFYPGGVMGDDKAVMRKMRVGQLHGAVLTAGGLVNTYKDIAIYNMPMLFRSEAEVDYVRARIDEKLMRGLEENKFVGFGLAEVGFAYPMSQEKVTAVREMRARKIWTPDNDPASLVGFEAFDISPIPLPIADVLAGLQTGLIDVVASPPIGTIALQWHTQVDYALDLPLLYVYGLFTIAERPFGRLAKEHQVVVREELEAAVAEVNAGARRDHENAKRAITQQGIEWLRPAPVEFREWQDMADAASRRLIANEYVTPELFDEVVGHLAEFRGRRGQ